jgi:hypothetical protein
VTVAVGGPQFVFVQTSRFHERQRPSTVIVNNTTIINNTRVINNVRHETRTIAGAGSQKVVVNEGPGVEVVQKATGKPVKVASIREVAARTSVPAAVKAKSKERATTPQTKQPQAAPTERRETPNVTTREIEKSKGREKETRPVAPVESPKSLPERKTAPGETREFPAKRSAPDYDSSRTRERPGFGPVPPPNAAPGVPATRGSSPGERPAKGKGKSSDKDKDKDHEGEGHGKDKP